MVQRVVRAVVVEVVLVTLEQVILPQPRPVRATTVVQLQWILQAVQVVVAQVLWVLQQVLPVVATAVMDQPVPLQDPV